MRDSMGAILRKAVHSAEPLRGATPKSRVFEAMLALSPSNTTKCQRIAGAGAEKRLYGISKTGRLHPLSDKDLKCAGGRMVFSTGEAPKEGETCKDVVERSRTVLPYCVFHQRITVEHRPVYFGVSFPWRESPEFLALCNGLDGIGAKDGEGHSGLYEPGRLWVAAKGDSAQYGLTLGWAPDVLSRVDIAVAIDCHVAMRKEKVADMFVVVSSPDWKMRRHLRETGEQALQKDALAILEGLFAKVQEKMGRLLPNPRVFDVLELGSRE